MPSEPIPDALALLEKHSFTFLIEAPATVWDMGWQRPPVRRRHPIHLRAGVFSNRNACIDPNLSARNFLTSSFKGVHRDGLLLPSNDSKYSYARFIPVEAFINRCTPSHAASNQSRLIQVHQPSPIQRSVLLRRGLLVPLTVVLLELLAHAGKVQPRIYLRQGRRRSVPSGGLTPRLPLHFIEMPGSYVQSTPRRPPAPREFITSQIHAGHSSRNRTKSQTRPSKPWLHS
jgi:hypothetical protein